MSTEWAGRPQTHEALCHAPARTHAHPRLPSWCVARAGARWKQSSTAGGAGSSGGQKWRLWTRSGATVALRWQRRCACGGRGLWPRQRRWAAAGRGRTRGKTCKDEEADLRLDVKTKRAAEMEWSRCWSWTNAAPWWWWWCFRAREPPARRTTTRLEHFGTRARTCVT